MHAGEVIADEHGHAGVALYEVHRLLDSAQLRTAQQLSGADLVVALSDRFYREAVARGVDPSRYRRVDVTSREHSGSARIYFPNSITL
ncbi:hypothetical protein [Actinomadura sp. 9N215]|uniref:hypothetical protein n=1 Tax=Actinomadura sp. 9N215 TaxID=3375150 RepID=UPI0037AC7B57